MVNNTQDSCSDVAHNASCSETPELQIGQFVVYPTHGIGKIINKEYIEFLNQEMYIIFFQDEEITLKVPIRRALKVGLRHISTPEAIHEVFEQMKLRETPIRGGIWNKRSQEYEKKINSGNLLLVAEVMCDLYYNAHNPERSYSERIIHEIACNRFKQEVSISLEKDITEIDKLVYDILNIDHTIELANHNDMNKEDDDDDSDLNKHQYNIIDESDSMAA